MGHCLHQAGPKGRQKVGRHRPQGQAIELLEIIRKDPFRTPPRFEKLVGDLAGAYSRRINIQHRLVYEVLEQEKIIKILRMWTHYG